MLHDAFDLLGGPPSFFCGRLPFCFVADVSFFWLASEREVTLLDREGSLIRSLSLAFFSCKVRTDQNEKGKKV